MDEYLNEIKRLKITFQSIPFVEEIYLCNSITFNALDENSDIDLFIIAEP
jgi:predicted nucleotidyltransferase